MLQEARMEWKQYQEVGNIIQELQEDPDALDQFVWNDDFLLYRDHLYLCKNSQLKYKFLSELHNYPIGGHSGFSKTYHRIKNDFF